MFFLLRSMVFKVIRLLSRNKALWLKLVVNDIPVKRTASSSKILIDN